MVWNPLHTPLFYRALRGVIVLRIAVLPNLLSFADLGKADMVRGYGRLHVLV